MIEINDLIGIPYKVHGRDKNGYDCYGLVIEVLRRCGKTLPDVFYDNLGENTCDKIKIINEGLYINKVQNPCEYCIVSMSLKGYESHVAVYIGEGRIIHARENLGVVVEDLRKFSKHIAGYFIVGE